MANGRLYQCCAVVLCIIDDITERNNCKATFAYLYYITICGKTKNHDANLQRFLDAVAAHNLTFDKSNLSDCISLLGY